MQIHSESSGIRISVVSAPFEFSKVNSTGSAVSALPLDPEAALRKAFTKISKVDLSEAQAEFESFRGSWRSCYPGLSSCVLTNPIFTPKGDLLFELQLAEGTVSST